jgi:hypothetical protein
MSDKARLNGWKRYPVREEPMKFEIPEGQNDNVNPFIPFKKDSEFKCLIRYHNLKKVEIGALLKAICFNNRGFHSIGFAKPYGYGKVKITATITSNSIFTKEEYLSAFTTLMQSHNPDYTKSKELRELNLMSEPQETKSPLEYMKLSDFVDCKRQKRNPTTRELEQTGNYLEYYSNLIKQRPTTSERKDAEAIVTLVAGPVVKAKLLEGKDMTPKILKVDGKRPKEGNKIIVEVIRKGGNIDYFIFKSIIKK